MKTAFLMVDPQNDFCHPDGSMFVAGADKDCERLIDALNRLSDKIDAVFVTMDEHHFFDIAHPAFWVDKNKKHPAPYTIIKSADVRAEIWQTAVEDYAYRALEYLKLLEMSQNYNCCVWPPHCIIGSWGACLDDRLVQALNNWESNNPGRIVEFIQKGMNIFTEHYSAVRAEVPDPEDKSTMTNMKLVDELKKCDLILIGGEALSHCVANTLRDLIEYIPCEKFCLLTDTTSNVAGFEKFGADFLAEMSKMGVQMATSSMIELA